jgi:hypothetical protein
MYMSLAWNGYADYREITFAAFPSNPFALEFLWDTNNGTATQRLRARYWDIGSSAGAFVDSNGGGGGASATDQPVEIRLGQPNDALVTTRIGRIIVSDDITEDLSAVSEGGAAAELMGQACL